MAGHVMVGAEVILRDGRGCWTRHRVRPTDDATADRITLAGNTWARLPFLATGSVVQSVPVYQSRRPAIGPNDHRVHSLYLPEGWHAPSGGRTA